MPNPTAGQVHVDVLLTDISVAYVQSSTKFVADRLFPMVPVQRQSDRYAVYNQGDFLRDEVDKRSPGAAPKRIGYNVSSTNTYTADEWAAEHAIDDQVRANVSGPYAPEEDATRFLTQKMMIRRERQFVTQFFSTGNLWTGSSDAQDLVSGTDFTAWSNAASSPIEDLHKQMSRIESNTGFLPNKLCINRQVWFDLKNHPDIVDRTKYTSRDAVSTDLVARLLGIDEVLVAAGVRNTKDEGLAHSGSYIAADNALLVYAAPSPSLMVPSGGYTFAWTGLIGSNQGQVIESYREDRNVSDIIRIRAAWSQKVIAANVGVFFKDCSTNM